MSKCHFRDFSFSVEKMFENVAVTKTITANAVKKKCLVFMFVPFLVGLVF